MHPLIGLFFGKLLSPIVFIPALAVGFFARRWWHVIVGTFVLAIIMQVIAANGPRLAPDLSEFVVSYLATLSWGALAYFFQDLRRKRAKPKYEPL